MSWEKIFFIIGLVLLGLFFRSFSDKVRRSVGLIAGVLFIVMLLRNAPEAIELVEKYTDTLWPVVSGNAERLIDKFGDFMKQISKI
ncbi:MAG: hypothetical protein JL50_01145 [Peptococcaceae bacterium BICA1-7]|nr:MAG: hypothetical protein JL50_01145 [Peptococcaceae bacterium BICA1-7]HBV98005.1 hypothetical protein [Desulfotomaculum sp.]